MLKNDFFQRAIETVKELLSFNACVYRGVLLLAQNQQKDKFNDFFGTPSFKPLEMKIADAVFFKIRNNMLLIKDLNHPKVHYSAFLFGSTLDIHITSENCSDSRKKHTQVAKLEIDWDFFIQQVIEYVRNNRNNIIKTVKMDDPEWQDLEIKYLPYETLETLQLALCRKRWNVNEKIIETFETLKEAKLKELAGEGLTLSFSSEGLIILSNGTDCMIFDFDELPSIGDKIFASSIRQIDVKHYTVGTLILLIKIRLLNIRREIIHHLTRKNC